MENKTHIRQKRAKLTLDKNNFKTKTETKNKEGHYMM